MTLLRIDDDDDESDEIYACAICVHEGHLNSFLSMLFLFSIFLYEKMKREGGGVFSQ